jgi:hypothetical protein
MGFKDEQVPRVARAWFYLLKLATMRVSITGATKRLADGQM